MDLEEKKKLATLNFVLRNTQAIANLREKKKVSIEKNRVHQRRGGFVKFLEVVLQ